MTFQYVRRTHVGSKWVTSSTQSRTGQGGNIAPRGPSELQSYEVLKAPGGFSEGILEKMLRGLSARNYQETLLETSQAFGVSPNTLSWQLLAVTTQKLKEFKERNLSGVSPFAIFIDTLHRLKVPGVL
jgi:hypothetical protein